MPALSDHIRRDAEHAARSDIRVELMRYVRRLDEMAKSEIKLALEKAEKAPPEEAKTVDGLELGRAAAAAAVSAYLGAAAPRRAIPAKAADPA